MPGDREFSRIREVASTGVSQAHRRLRKRRRVRHPPTTNPGSCQDGIGRDVTFVRSIKHECLRHIVPLGERHLRAVVREFVEHYHAERNHQGLGNVVPFPSPDSVARVGRVERRQRLGGLLNFYERKAA